MPQAIRCNATVIRKGQVIEEFMGLTDVKCNEGYVVFISNGGKDGVIFLPERGDKITVTTVECDIDAAQYQ